MKCIVFTTYIPTEDKIWIGLEFLDKFVEKFKDYDIYIGDSNSCEEWLEVLEGYKKDLNINYRVVPNHLDSGYGVVGAFQTALTLLKESGKKYDFCWFGHTKGVSSGSHNFRKQVFEDFWDIRETVEYKMTKEDFIMYSPYITLTDSVWLNGTLPLFLDGPDNDSLSSLYAFWVHKGEVIEKFLEVVNPLFFNKNILEMDRLNYENCHPEHPKIDRYFFERDFPMIYQKLNVGKKVLYRVIDGGHKKYLGDSTIDKKTNGNIFLLDNKYM